MALVSDLVGKLAELEGRSAASVALIARYLREAGYLSQGARGRNAPHATATDCSNLLIALHAGADTAKEAPSAIERFRNLVLRPAPLSRDIPATYHLFTEPGAPSPVVEIINLSDNFGTALDRILQSCADEALDCYLLDQAAVYIPEEKVARVSDPNHSKTSADFQYLVDTARSFVQLRIVDLAIEFHSPLPSSSIRVSRSNVINEVLLNASFIVHTID